MQDRVRECVLEVLEAATGTKGEGVYLVGVSLKGSPVHRKIDVVLDADSGVAVGQCAFLSRRIRERLEEDEVLADWMGEDFDLTVGSPGLGEPIVLRRQYSRHRGRLLAVRYRSEEGEEVDLLGRLLEVSLEPEGEAFIEIRPEPEGKKGRKAAGEPLRLALASIVRAVPEPEL